MTVAVAAVFGAKDFATLDPKSTEASGCGSAPKLGNRRFLIQSGSRLGTALNTTNVTETKDVVAGEVAQELELTGSTVPWFQKWPT